MKLFNKKEKTPEQKLVDKLVGSGFTHNQNLTKMNINNENKILLFRTVNKIWKDGGSSEEIQSKYDETIENIPIINSNKNLVDSLVGTGIWDKGLLKNLNLDYDSKKIIKKEVLSAWENGSDSEELKKIYHDLSNNQLNEKNKNEVDTNKRKQIDETKKKVNKELEYIKKHGEEKFLVNKLVGAGLIYNSNVSKLNISNYDKNALQKTVKTAWKNGASKDEIQKLYDLTLHEIKNKKYENELIGIEKVNFKSKVDKKRDYIRQGVYCELAKSVEGTTSDGLSNIGLTSLAFGFNKYSFALAALGSGSDIEHKTIGVPSKIKVVPKGIVLSPQNDDEIRIPFDKIINYDEYGINLIEGQRIVLKTCEYRDEVRYLINESACGVDEEGWN